MGSGPAEALCSAIELILALDRQSAIAAAKARERATAVNDIFEKRIQETLGGQSGSGPIKVEPFKRDTLAIHGEVSNSKSREEAFLDAFQALMELNAKPAYRNDCRLVFDRLRLAKLVDYDHLLKVAEMDPKRLESDPSQDPAERKLDLLRSFQAFQLEMHQRLERSQEELGKAADRCRTLLEEALAVSRRIAEADDRRE
jgi:hypothetical protein